jgi:hypothetical protein
VKEVFHKVFGDHEPDIWSFEGPNGEGIYLLGGLHKVLGMVATKWEHFYVYEGEDGYFQYSFGKYQGMPFLIGGMGSSMQSACNSLYVLESDREKWEDEFPELTIDIDEEIKLRGGQNV